MRIIKDNCEKIKICPFCKSEIAYNKKDISSKILVEGFYITSKAIKYINCPCCGKEIHITNVTIKR